MVFLICRKLKFLCLVKNKASKVPQINKTQRQIQDCCNITKRCILYVAAALDPPLLSPYSSLNTCFLIKTVWFLHLWKNNSDTYLQSMIQFFFHRYFKLETAKYNHPGTVFHHYLMSHLKKAKKCFQNLQEIHNVFSLESEERLKKTCLNLPSL